MGYLGSYHGRMTILMTFVLVTLSACAPLQKTAPDPQIFSLQEELRYVRKSSKTSETAVKDIYGQLQALDGKVDRVEKVVEESMPGVQQDLEKMRTWSVSTQETIEDVHVRLRALEAKVDKLENSVEELVSRLQATAASQKPAPAEVSRKSRPTPPKAAQQATVEQAVAVPEERKPPAPADVGALRAYEEAYGAYVERRYDEGLSLFKEFLNRYPDHELTDNAQYWLGEIYYDMGDYPSAILAFKDVVTRYPDADKAPDALLKIAYAYLALDDPSNARMFLKRLTKKYPLSSAHDKAQAKLKEMEETP